MQNIANWSISFSLSLRIFLCVQSSRQSLAVGEIWHLRWNLFVISVSNAYRAQFLSHSWPYTNVSYHSVSAQCRNPNPLSTTSAELPPKTGSSLLPQAGYSVAEQFWWLGSSKISLPAPPFFLKQSIILWQSAPLFLRLAAIADWGDLFLGDTFE